MKFMKQILHTRLSRDLKVYKDSKYRQNLGNLCSLFLLKYINISICDMVDID